MWLHARLMGTSAVTNNVHSAGCALECRTSIRRRLWCRIFQARQPQQCTHTVRVPFAQRVDSRDIDDTLPPRWEVNNCRVCPTNGSERRSRLRKLMLRRHVARPHHSESLLRRRCPSRHEGKATEARVNGLTGQTAAAASKRYAIRARAHAHTHARQSNDPRTCFLERYAGRRLTRNRLTAEIEKARRPTIPGGRRRWLTCGDPWTRPTPAWVVVSPGKRRRCTTGRQRAGRAATASGSALR